MLKALFYPAGTKAKPIPFDSLFIPYIYKEIYFDGVYVDVLNGRKDMVIMDIGANIGVTVQHFVPYAKKVYAVEPSSEHFEALKKNKEFNKWDNVEVFHAAFADKDGEMRLNYNPANRTSNSLTNDYGQGGETVKTFGFDSFMEQNKIDEVDFCKFDTENSEDMILRSEGFRKVAPKIKAIEVAFHNNQWPALAEYMVSLGYKARRYQCEEILLLFTR
jgi:FkbM family methyltransferase